MTTTPSHPASRLPRPVLHHPANVAMMERRANSMQLRVADAITTFAGSMKFVYVHIVVFAAWMLSFEKSPGRRSRWSCRWRPSSCRPSS